jgi:hypothetical protein
MYTLNTGVALKVKIENSLLKTHIFFKDSFYIHHILVAYFQTPGKMLN